jgi:asparagine synthase (glutamine-hydrolysing)
VCGICGVLNFDGAPVSHGTLAAMRSTIRHRGPDDESQYTADGVGLGICRLSIIDLSSGNQPIGNEDGSVHIVFNGEIYNYPELRARLIARGHRFRTHSDTEVIVHLYEDHGEGCLAYLEGMFAFAIWDGRQQKVLLARDRLGEKPLVYHLDDNRLVFGSEIKAVTASGIPREIDLDAVYHYFTLMSVPAPLTIFKGVRKLMPGHYLSCDHTGTVKICRYWDVTDWHVTPGRTEGDRLAELKGRLDKAVRQRLQADVPVGALLSGGIDSSLVVAIMNRVSNEQVQTFSVGFDGLDDELPFARQVAGFLNTVHHEVIVRPDVSALLPKLVWHWDEPFAVSSAIPTYLVSKVAREHVKVVLTGDGGDELFAGYPRYRWDQWADRLSILGYVGGRALAPTLEFLSRHVDRLRRVARHVSSLRMGSDERYTYYLSKIDSRGKRALLSRDLLQEFDRRWLVDTAVLDAAYRSFHGANPLDRRLYGDIKASLADEMLTKIDRMSMAASLEARPPLLDHHIVEYAAKLPPTDKLRGAAAKYLLRRVSKDLLPPEISDRPKHGFNVPVGDWMRRALKPFAEDVLFSSRASTRGVWQPAAVRRLWDRHQSGESGLGEQLWVLLNWELWCQVVYDDARLTRDP